MLKRIEVCTDKYWDEYVDGYYVRGKIVIRHYEHKEIVINTDRIENIDVDNNIIEMQDGTEYRLYYQIDSDLLDELGIE